MKFRDIIERLRKGNQRCIRFCEDMIAYSEKRIEELKKGE